MLSFLKNNNRIGVLACFLLLVACRQTINVEDVERIETGSDQAWQDLEWVDGRLLAVGGRGSAVGTYFDGSQTDSLWEAVLFDLEVVVDTTYLCGAFGAYFVQNRGGDWEKIQLPTFSSLRKMAWLPSGTGVIAASNFLSDGQLIRMGQRFQVDTIFETEAAIADVAFSAPDTVTAVGYGVVYRSVDGGWSWEQLPVDGDFFRSIQFVDRQVGYICGLNGTLLKTTDGGAHWRTLRSAGGIGQGITPFRSLYFATAEEGYVCGNESTLWKTTDGGASWKTVQNLPQGDYHAVITDSSHVYVAGSDGLLFSFLR